MNLQGTLRNYTVYFMLFIYVVIVALVSAWLIAYTRCVTIGAITYVCYRASVRKVSLLSSFH